MVRELRWKEEVAGGHGPCRGSPGPGTLERDQFQEQQQELEKIRQQLLCAAGLLTSFTNHTVDRYACPRYPVATGTHPTRPANGMCL